MHAIFEPPLSDEVVVTTFGRFAGIMLCESLDLSKSIEACLAQFTFILNRLKQFVCWLRVVCSHRRQFLFIRVLFWVFFSLFPRDKTSRPLYPQIFSIVRSYSRCINRIPHTRLQIIRTFRLTEIRLMFVCFWIGIVCCWSRIVLLLLLLHKVLKDCMTRCSICYWSLWSGLSRNTGLVLARRR